jgi:hypothetical protein
MQNVRITIGKFKLLRICWPKRKKGDPSGSAVLERRSAAARLLGLWVRITMGHGCFSLESVVFCQVEVSASE